MHRLGQLLLRHVDRLRDGRPLVLVNPPPDELAPTLADLDIAVSVHTTHRGDWQTLDRLGLEPAFDAFPPRVVPHSARVVLFAPREKARFRMLADAARAALAGSGGTLWLAGDKRAGIKSTPRVIDGQFATCTKLDAARHGALYRAGGPGSGPFEPDRYRTAWTLQGDHEPLRLVSWPGVFAHGHLDPGTRFLLDYVADDPPSGRVLDFACGCGVIGLALVKWYTPPGSLTFSDVDAMALYATRANLEMHDIEADLVASDGLDEVTGPFDVIVANPPFHRGVEQDTSIVARFLAAARDRLAARGRLLIVANRHLPYARYLDETFGNHRTVASNPRYQVLSSHAGLPPNQAPRTAW